MKTRVSSRRVLGAVAALTTGLLALTACSAGTESEESQAGSNTADINYHAAEGAANEDLRALLPESVLEAGRIVIATDATIGEPFGSYDVDNVTMLGVAPDIAYAIGDELGLDVELQQVVFASLIPGLKAERFEFSLAPMLNTEERQLEVDFIDFLQGGSAFIIAQGSSVSSELAPENACGLRIGYASGSVEEIIMEEQSAQCVEAGEEPIEGLAYRTNNEGVLALTSDRIDAYATAAAQAGYITITDDEQLEVSGEPFQGGYSGMAFPKDSDVLPAIQATFQELIDNGTYEEILTGYGIEYLAVDATESTVES